MSKRADDVARELGLEFDVVEKSDAQGKVVALVMRFKFPDVRAGLHDKTVAPVRPDPAAAKAHAESPEGKAFAEVVKRVTLWRKKVEPWVYKPQPPGTDGIALAAELTFGNRFRVKMTNRANAKVMAKFMSPNALARRAALAQTTPQAALNALRDTLKLYGVKEPDPDTVKLKSSLEESARVVAAAEARDSAPVFKKPEEPTKPVFH